MDGHKVCRLRLILWVCGFQLLLLVDAFRDPQAAWRRRVALTLKTAGVKVSKEPAVESYIEPESLPDMALVAERFARQKRELTVAPKYDPVEVVDVAKVAMIELLAVNQYEWMPWYWPVDDVVEFQGRPMVVTGRGQDDFRSYPRYISLPALTDRSYINKKNRSRLKRLKQHRRALEDWFVQDSLLCKCHENSYIFARALLELLRDLPLMHNGAKVTGWAVCGGTFTGVDAPGVGRRTSVLSSEDPDNLHEVTQWLQKKNQSLSEGVNATAALEEKAEKEKWHWSGWEGNSTHEGGGHVWLSFCCEDQTVHILDLSAGQFFVERSPCGTTILPPFFLTQIDENEPDVFPRKDVGCKLKTWSVPTRTSLRKTLNEYMNSWRSGYSESHHDHNSEDQSLFQHVRWSTNRQYVRELRKTADLFQRRLGSVDGLLKKIDLVKDNDQMFTQMLLQYPSRRVDWWRES